MNDDLNVKQAFDALLSTLLQLTKLSRKNKMTPEDDLAYPRYTHTHKR